MRVVVGLVAVSAWLRGQAPRAGATGPCDHFGIHDPFSDSYCDDAHEECACLRASSQAEFERICAPYSAAYEACLQGLQDEIAKVKGCVKEAQGARRAQHNQTMDQIGDALRSLPSLNSQSPSYGPFSRYCSDTCASHSALCGQYPAPGCNTQLDRLEHQVSLLTGYAEMLGWEWKQFENLGGTSC
jgi:hypothetical protein